MFSGKKILVGVTGGIAAYKTCEIIRDLVKEGAEVQVVMTQAAQKFIGPLTFETLSDREVLLELFPPGKKVSTRHIAVAEWADRVLVCPATANIIGKVASGIADDLLSTLLMVAKSKTIFCPAMNSEMYSNPIVQENIRKLEALGYKFVKPEWGELACGTEGWGRLATKERILNFLKVELLKTEELVSKRVLVTAGRTEEPIDPVRIITNRASGKMGFALAEAAALRGAQVTLISGPTVLQPLDGIKYTEVQTAEEMASAVAKEFPSSDIILMAAAVADYRPAVFSENKIKKGGDKINLELVKTQDILKELGKRKGDRILVGFSVETDKEIENSLRKLREKNLDLIVCNNPLKAGAAFATDTNIVTIIDKNGGVEELPRMSKSEVAKKILDKVAEIVWERANTAAS